MFAKTDKAAAPAAAPAAPSPSAPADHRGVPITDKGTIQGLDPQTDALLRRMATGHTYFDSEIAKLTRGYGDMSKLVRMGLIARSDNYGSYNKKTGKMEDSYFITDKGIKVVGGLTDTRKPQGISPGRLSRQIAQEAYQNDPNSSAADDQAEKQGGAPQNGFAQPQGQPQATQQAAPAPTQPKPAAQPMQGSQQAMQSTGPNSAGSQPTAQAPSQDDTMAAQQIADKLKNTNPDQLDGEIQKSLVATGKTGADEQNMTDLVKQKMGVNMENSAPRKRKV